MLSNEELVEIHTVLHELIQLSHNHPEIIVKPILLFYMLRIKLYDDTEYNKYVYYKALYQEIRWF